jgi:uncharacterized damage-inducible protein DinB
MNKAYFAELARYNIWANDMAMGWLEQISGEQWEQATVSSFSSVRKTALHIASAEKIWVDFWTNVPYPLYLSEDYKGTKEELITIWKRSSEGLREFIESYPEEGYSQPVTFRYPHGGEGQMEFWQTFAHVFNHSTYHRGQLVCTLRQVGFTSFSSVDLVTFYRLRSKTMLLID